MDTSHRAPKPFGVVLSLLATMSLAGCAIYGRELRSMPTVGPEAAVVVHRCPSNGIVYWPAGGAELCFSYVGVEVEAEAMNAEHTAFAIGPLLPLIPFFPKKAERSEPLEVELGLLTKERYGFDPWRVLVRTAQGEVIGVSRVETNVRDDHGVHTVELDPHARETRELPGRFFLKFERHVALEQEFFLTLQLIGPGGAEVPVPTIRFRQGKVSYLGSIP
jgi:hypothetical protein